MVRPAGPLPAVPLPDGLAHRAGRGRRRRWSTSSGPRPSGFGSAIQPPHTWHGLPLLDDPALRPVARPGRRATPSRPPTASARRACWASTRVSTVPAARRRGAGTAITARARGRRAGPAGRPPAQRDGRAALPPPRLRAVHHLPHLDKERLMTPTSRPPSPTSTPARRRSPGAPAIPGLRFRHYAGPRDHPVMVRRVQPGAPGATATRRCPRWRRSTSTTPTSSTATRRATCCWRRWTARWSRTAASLWEDMNDGIRGYHSFGFVDPGVAASGHRLRRCIAGSRTRNLAIAADHDRGPAARPAELGVRRERRATWPCCGTPGYAVDRRFVQMVRPTLEAIAVAAAAGRAGGAPRLDGPRTGRVRRRTPRRSATTGGGPRPPMTRSRRWRDQPGHGPVPVGDRLGRRPGRGRRAGSHRRGRRTTEYGYQRGWLDSVFVRRPWRSRGLAKALIGRALVVLRTRGMTSAQLGVDVDNVNRALDLYTGAGFAVARTESAWRKPWPEPVPVPDGESALTGWRRR